MAEIGPLASVIQVASTSVQLSIFLYTFADNVSITGKAVKGLANDVAFTASILDQFQVVLDPERQERTVSREALEIVDSLVEGCSNDFTEIALLVGKHFRKTSEKQIRKRRLTMETLKWPFIQPKIDVLRSNFEKHKTKLILMAQVLTFAKVVASK